MAIIGRPNAGKSTLLNAILEFKLAIRHAQGTDYPPSDTGYSYSEAAHQMVFLDTPGIIGPEYKLQEAMMQAVARSTNGR